MIKFVIDSVVQAVKLLGGKPSVFKVLTTITGALPAIIGQVIDFKNADAKTKADEFLAALDAYTGTDQGAVRIFPHMPPEREEEFWDAFKIMARNYIYEQLKVDGYHVD